MKSSLSTLLMVALLFAHAPAQTNSPQPQDEPDDIVRISAELVQTDVVVTDKNDRIVGDLSLEDFEVYDDGKRQEVQFMEFVSVDAGRRTEGRLPGRTASTADLPRDLSARDLKRVIAFVVDDLTIPNEDLVRVRAMLSDFVDNKMMEGDLVAIVRVVGGRSLLQQFTGDRQLLRRAVASLTPRSNPYSAFGNSETDRLRSSPVAGGGSTSNDGSEFGPAAGFDLESPTDDTNRTVRALMALVTADQVIESLQQVPGRKSLVLVSGGLPLYEMDRNAARAAATGEGRASLGGTSTIIGNVSQLLSQLADRAVRSGVVINTLDARGLKVAGAVARFVDTPAKSALGVSGPDPYFGRQPDPTLFGDANPFDRMAGELGLRELASSTGGVAVVNSNNFGEGLERVLQRSSGYYRLAYRPTEKFDEKFRKVQVKVKRDGLRVHAPEGYVARADKPVGELKKEEAILKTAMSPLAARDLEVSTNLQYKLTQESKAALDLHVFIDAKKLNFQQTPEGKYRTSFDVVGFVYNHLGRSLGGFSETVNTMLTPESYQKALAEGLSYTRTTEVPPGYYQVRAVVREEGTGHLGSSSRYFEIPNLANKRLAASSLFLYAVNPASGGGREEVLPLGALHKLTRRQDLRYAVVIYNTRTEKNRPQVRTQLTISQGGKVLYQEPEQPVEVKEAQAAGQLVKVGQLGLSKVQPGRYVMTLQITDAHADKKQQSLTRSVEFVVE